MSGKAEKGNTTALFIVRGFLIFVLNLIFYVVVVLGAVETCKVTYSFANEVFGDVISEPPPGTDKTFEIKKADDLLTVSKNLESSGIVSNAYSFYIRLKLSMNEKSIVKAGKYQLNTSMTYEEILNVIVKGGS